MLKWARGSVPIEPMWADGDEEPSGRTQRQTMALKDVRYRLHAQMIPWQPSLAGKISQRVSPPRECREMFRSAQFWPARIPGLLRPGERRFRTFRAGSLGCRSRVDAL